MTEYKTHSQSTVQWIYLMPAIFQLQIGTWILHPIASFLGYEIYEAQIVYVHRRKKQAVGFHEIELDYAQIEREIDETLQRFNNPALLIPPRRFKCLSCAECYKSRCPFQERANNVKEI